MRRHLALLVALALFGAVGVGAVGTGPADAASARCWKGKQWKPLESNDAYSVRSRSVPAGAVIVSCDRNTGRHWTVADASADQDSDEESFNHDYWPLILSGRWLAYRRDADETAGGSSGGERNTQLVLVNLRTHRRTTVARYDDSWYPSSDPNDPGPPPATTLITFVVNRAGAVAWIDSIGVHVRPSGGRKVTVETGPGTEMSDLRIGTEHVRWTRAGAPRSVEIAE